MVNGTCVCKDRDKFNRNNTCTTCSEYCEKCGMSSWYSLHCFDGEECKYCSVTTTFVVVIVVGMIVGGGFLAIGGKFYRISELSQLNSVLTKKNYHL
jgi:hypothetical protein